MRHKFLWCIVVILAGIILIALTPNTGPPKDPVHHRVVR